jgi:hypothetical protein
MRVRRTILSSEKIREINDAVLIVKHFIELSSKLLPILNELNEKHPLSIHEEQDKQKIIDVFDSYKFDTVTSAILMDSPILDLIKETYESIITKESHLIKLESEKFIIEYSRLKNNWKKAQLN